MNKNTFRVLTLIVFLVSNHIREVLTTTHIHLISAYTNREVLKISGANIYKILLTSKKLAQILLKVEQ